MVVSFLDSALEYLASWSITELRIFVAGVTTTLVLSILIQKHALLRIWLHKALAPVVGTIWKDRKTNAKVVDGDAEGHDEGPNTTETSITRPPFRFRERLWHEPPEFGYEQYECFAEVQKDIKQSGRNVEQKTHWLDIQSSSSCLIAIMVRLGRRD